MLSATFNRLVQPHPAEAEYDSWRQEEARAERLADSIRMIYLVIWVLATLPAIGLHPPRANLGNVGIGLAWLFGALLYMAYLRRNAYQAWQKYASTAFDILMIVAILYLYHFDMGYSTALKAPPFMNFMLTLALAAFRFDRWLPLFGVLLAILLYGGLFGLLLLTQPIAFGSPLEMFTIPQISLLYQFYRLWYLIGLAIVLVILVENVRRLVGERVIEAERAQAEQLQREQTQQLFERYFSPEIASYLSEHPQQMGGTMQKVTVLISDLRGFTALSEKLGPEKTVELLNRLFETLTEIVFRYNGTLDKYLGDGMLVVFGTPDSRPDDAYRAVQCAQEMVRFVDRLGFEHDSQLGIGIDSGEVIFGNVGSHQRMELTVIGDAVNMASRIEGLNKQLGTQILISQMTLDQIDAPLEVRRLGKQAIRGRTEPIELVEIAI